MAEGWTIYAKTQQVNAIPSSLKVDLCDINGTVLTSITAQGYIQGNITIGVADGNAKRYNTTPQKWADTTTSWGSPTHLKFTDASNNVWGLFPITVTSGTMPIGDITEYANIAIGQIIFG